MNEDELIAAHLKPLASGDVWRLSNDGAKTDAFNAVTADCLLEGVHFPAAAEPKFIAEKLLRVNLSDFAAMGATPKVYLLCLAVANGQWLAKFALGLRAAGRRFSVALGGGDLVKSNGRCFASLTLLGDHGKRPLTRSGVAPGDDVYVSGGLGAAAAQKYATLPEPRLELGKGLLGIATAAIDVSDGLALDLERLCRESEVAMSIQADDVPIAAELARATLPAAAKRKLALSGGEDYELAFTASPLARRKIARLGERLGIALTVIGKAESKARGLTSGKAERDSLRLFTADGERLLLAAKGYRHF